MSLSQSQCVEYLQSNLVKHGLTGKIEPDGIFRLRTGSGDAVGSVRIHPDCVSVESPDAIKLLDSALSEALGAAVKEAAFSRKGP